MNCKKGGMVNPLYITESEVTTVREIIEAFQDMDEEEVYKITQQALPHIKEHVLKNVFKYCNNTHDGSIKIPPQLIETILKELK